MKNASKIAAFILISSAMILPTQADFIADQSRLSISAPQVPGLDLVNSADFSNRNLKY